MIRGIQSRSPVLGGFFGVWGGLYGVYNCALKEIRHQDDPYKYDPHLLKYNRLFMTFSYIAAGGLAGGSLSIRGTWVCRRECTDEE